MSEDERAMTQDQFDAWLARLTPEKRASFDESMAMARKMLKDPDCLFISWTEYVASSAIMRGSDSFLRDSFDADCKDEGIDAAAVRDAVRSAQARAAAGGNRPTQDEADAIVRACGGRGPRKRGE